MRRSIPGSRPSTKSFPATTCACSWWNRPGVLADVARVLASRQIGISSVIQPEAHLGETTALVLMLHDAPESQLKAAVSEISRIGAVKAPPVPIRVEDFESIH